MKYRAVALGYCCWPIISPSCGADDRAFRRVEAHPHVNESLISRHIIYAIGVGLAFRTIRAIIHGRFARRVLGGAIRGRGSESFRPVPLS